MREEAARKSKRASGMISLGNDFGFLSPHLVVASPPPTCHCLSLPPCFFPLQFN